MVPVIGSTGSKVAKKAGGSLLSSTDEFADVVVIGEDMDRVRRAAVATDGRFYEPPDLDNIVDALNANKSWINEQMDHGATIIDIGPAPGRKYYPNATSMYYGVEIHAIAIRNYERYYSGDVL